MTDCPGWKTCIKSATRSYESIKLISCELRVIVSCMPAASQRRLNAFSRQRQLLNLRKVCQRMHGNCAVNHSCYAHECSVL